MKNASFWLKNMIIQLKDLDARERTIQVQVLELLLEIERRKAFVEMGYDGLFSFCVKELGYSEAQSYQRIQAMHALESVPEIKNKIETGVLNLTTVVQVQKMIRQDRVEARIHRNAEQKLHLFETFQGKTTREVKSQIAELRGERVVTKLYLELDDEAEGLLKEVRSKSAHQTQGSDLLCLKMLMKTWLKQKENEDRPRRAISGSLQPGKGSTTFSQTQLEPITKVKPTTEMSTPSLRASELFGGALVRTQLTKTSLQASQSSNPNSQISKTSRTASFPKSVTLKLKREILDRDQYQCSHCGSKHALQIDHIQPRANQGASSRHNLRVLCRNCNLHFAVKEFGLKRVKRV